MRRNLVVGAVVIGLAGGATPAAAEDPPEAHRATLELGLGAPWGATLGLGVRHRRVQVVGEVGEIGAPFIFGFATVGTVRADVTAPGRRTVYTGLSVSRSWFIAGSDDTAEWQLTTVGPNLGVRWQLRRRIAPAVEAGAMYGRCEGDCMSFGGTSYIGLQLGAKLAIGL